MNIIDLLKNKMHTNKQEENTKLKNGVVRYLSKKYKVGEEIEITKNWGGGYNKNGRPDLEIIFKNGITHYFELKDKKGKLSGVQERVIKRYIELNTPVFVVNDINDFINIWETQCDVK